MKCRTRSASTSPALAGGDVPDVGAEGGGRLQVAFRRSRRRQRQTAGVCTITEVPCGTMGWSAGYPGGRYCSTLPATGYDMPCGRCTPALPNPMPA